MFDYSTSEGINAATETLSSMALDAFESFYTTSNSSGNSETTQEPASTEESMQTAALAILQAYVNGDKTVSVSDALAILKEGAGLNANEEYESDNVSGVTSKITSWNIASTSSRSMTAASTGTITDKNGEEEEASVSVDGNYTFDEDGNLSEITYYCEGTDTTTTKKYNSNGSLTELSVKIPIYEYLTGADGSTVKTLSEYKNETTKYEYDSEGNLTKVINPDGSELTGDSLSEIEVESAPKNQKEIQDDLKKQSSIELSAYVRAMSGSGADKNEIEEIKDVVKTYEANGGTVTVGDAEYNDEGLITELNGVGGDPGGNKVSINESVTYDEDNNISTITYQTSDGSTIVKTYNADGTLQSESTTSIVTVIDGYDDNGELIFKEVEQTVVVTYEYDDEQRVIKKTTTGEINQNGLEYVGECLLNPTESYTYNEDGQLISSSIQYEGGQNSTHTYAYDDDGQFVSAHYVNSGYSSMANDEGDSDYIASTPDDTEYAPTTNGEIMDELASLASKYIPLIYADM